MASNDLAASKTSSGWLDRRFALSARNTSVRIETLAGITSFLAAAYLLVVIPSLLATGGMDRGAATTSTIIVFVLSTIFMGLYTNLPFIVGPGIGGSVILGVTLAATEHVAWQTGLGIAFISGVLFLILTLVGARSLVVRLIPAQIKLGLGASIGLFIAVLGFRNAGMVIANAKTNALALGDFSRPGTIVALIGLAAAVVLQGRRIPGAILWAILIAAAAGVPLGVTHLPQSMISFGRVLSGRSEPPLSTEVLNGDHPKIWKYPAIVDRGQHTIVVTLGQVRAERKREGMSPNPPNRILSLTAANKPMSRRWTPSRMRR